jgi:hypothetical protein
MSSLKKIARKKDDPYANGLDWPLDQWYIERVLFFIYGGITIFSIFLSFVFPGSSIFLIIGMLGGTAQVLFAYLGIDIFVKLLSSFGLKEKRDL